MNCGDALSPEDLLARVVGYVGEGCASIRVNDRLAGAELPEDCTPATLLDLLYQCYDEDNAALRTTRPGDYAQQRVTDCSPLPSLEQLIRECLTTTVDGDVAIRMVKPVDCSATTCQSECVAQQMSSVFDLFAIDTLGLTCIKVCDGAIPEVGRLPDCNDVLSLGGIVAGLIVGAGDNTALNATPI